MLLRALCLSCSPSSSSGLKKAQVVLFETSLRKFYFSINHCCNFLDVAYCLNTLSVFFFLAGKYFPDSPHHWWPAFLHYLQLWVNNLDHWHACQQWRKFSRPGRDSSPGRLHDHIQASLLSNTRHTFLEMAEDDIDCLEMVIMTKIIRSLNFLNNNLIFPFPSELRLPRTFSEGNWSSLFWPVLLSSLPSLATNFLKRVIQQWLQQVQLSLGIYISSYMFFFFLLVGGCSDVWIYH